MKYKFNNIKICTEILFRHWQLSYAKSLEDALESPKWDMLKSKFIIWLETRKMKYNFNNFKVCIDIGLS